MKRVNYTEQIMCDELNLKILIKKFTLKSINTYSSYYINYSIPK